MSDNNNVLIAGGLVLAYLMMSRRPAPVGAVQYPPGYVGTPPTMPASAGNGWQQMAQGAVAGFLNGLANGPRNNTSYTTIPSYTDPVDAYRGNIAQEGAGYFDGYGWVPETMF